MKQLKIHSIVSLLTVCLLCTVCPATLRGQDKPTTFTVTVLRSDSVPQQGMILKITGRQDRYTSDTKGVIRFEYTIDKNFARTATLYFPSDERTSVASLPLKAEETSHTFYLDSPDDLKTFRQTNKTFDVEGIVQQIDGEPITGAIISIQGTGRKTESDEIGLFRIAADYSHPITVRAAGMENRSIDISNFLQNPNEPYKVMLRAKSASHIYTSADQMPEYPGGMKAFMNYLKRHLNYPAQAKQEKREGVVVVQFVVEKNGAITSPAVVRPLEASMDSAALTAIRQMPRWIPAQDNGMTVRCRYSVPVQFKLEAPKPTDQLSSSASREQMKHRQDSLTALRLKTDSLRRLIPATTDNGLAVQPTDSLIQWTKADSLRMDTILQSIQHDSTAQPQDKKGNIFVRFFRWLFGKG